MIDAQPDEPQSGHKTTAKTPVQSTIANGSADVTCLHDVGATEQSIEIGRMIGWRYFAFSFLVCCPSLERALQQFTIDY